MSKNAVLTDENDEQLLPITTSENVFVSADMTLKQYLDQLSSGGSAYILPAASATQLGGVKVGEGLAIAEDGTLSCVLNGMSHEQIYLGGDIHAYVRVS